MTAREWLTTEKQILRSDILKQLEPLLIDFAKLKCAEQGANCKDAYYENNPDINIIILNAPEPELF